MATVREDQYAALRSFNRAWTQRVGALDESFLGTGRSLGASRLLFEVGLEGVGVRELRERLGLDSGYLSRLLRQLEAEGLLTVRPDPADRRRRTVTLTPSGARARRVLDDRSEQLARDLVAPLTDGQRSRLEAALSTAQLLIRAAGVTIDRVEPDSPDAVGSVRRYFAELRTRFPEGFDPGDAATTDVAGMRAPHGVFLVAHGEGRAVACGGVQPHTPTIGEIKRMWVDPEWRGVGLGARTLAALEDQARRLGYDHVYLDTNSTLTEAIAMYERAGYRSIERYNDNPYARHWFAKSLHGPSGTEVGPQTGM
jgi:DNA-binding MarR family transcriptional regulator/GNAT superfamily N-acetyltransferase